jgi:hypothetical protein
MDRKITLISIITILLISTSLVIPTVSGIISKNNKNEIDLQKSTTDTEYWAVIIGFLEYREGYNLPIHVNPAYHMYNSLCNSSGWKKENIQLLLDENATKEAILGSDGKTGFGWLRENATEDDIILFYFNGHGSQVEDINNDEEDGKDEIIAPYDIKKEGGILNGLIGSELVNYITDDMIDKELDKINCKGMCLIFDSCYCGGLAGGKNDVDTGPNRVIMTASNTEEGLPIVVNNGDCFATRVALSLNEKSTDENNDGKISAEEAFNCGRKAWLSTVTPWMSFLFYYMYLQGLIKQPYTLLFLYFMAGCRLPKPWSFPKLYDGDENEELIIVPDI